MNINVKDIEKMNVNNYIIRFDTKPFRHSLSNLVKLSMSIKSKEEVSTIIESWIMNIKNLIHSLQLDEVNQT